MEQTIDIIKRVSQKAANLSTWIRVAKSEQLFLDEVKNRIDTDLTIEDKYKNYTEIIYVIFDYHFYIPLSKFVFLTLTNDRLGNNTTTNLTCIPALSL